MVRDIIVLIWRKYCTKSVKRSKIITQQVKVIENPNIVDIKSFIIEPRKTSHKLFKTTGQAEMVYQIGSGNSFNNPFTERSKTKSENVLNEKNRKIPQ